MIRGAADGDAVRDCQASLAQFLPHGCDVYLLDKAATRTAVRDSGRDLLVLDANIRITAGAMEEMYAVLHLHAMHGAVSPRTNRAPLYSIPVLEAMAPEASYALWTRIRPMLKRYGIMPAAGQFCTLIRNSMLHHFGIENPLERANLHGFSTVAANQAYVFYFGETANTTEDADYLRFHLDPVERLAHVWHPRRPRVLMDLYHLTPWHSGTSEFGIGLLLHLIPKLSEKY